MKLRNKKTGESFNLDKLPEDVKRAIETGATYLWSNFELYQPEEPLIKDEKIRKAIRAWAEALESNVVLISYSRHDYLKIVDTKADCDICFDYELGYTFDEGNYTIAELCGEEEE